MHGALFSGAAVNAADQVGRDYSKNLGTAGQDELDQLLGIGGDETNLYNTVFGQLLNIPAAPDTSTPTATTDQSGFNADTGYHPAQAAATGDWIEHTAGAHPFGVGLKPPKPGVLGGHGHQT